MPFQCLAPTSDRVPFRGRSTRHAEVGTHRVRQPPGQHLSGRPVHDRHQIEEAAPHRDIGDIRAPDMVGPLDCQLAPQARIDPVRGMRIAGPGPLVDRRQAHLHHQPPCRPPSNIVTGAAQIARHLSAAVPRAVQEHRVDHPHQGQRLVPLRHRRVMIARPADRQQPALRRYRQSVMSGLDHRSPPCHAHRLEAFAKKSRSTNRSFPWRSAYNRSTGSIAIRPHPPGSACPQSGLIRPAATRHSPAPDPSSDAPGSSSARHTPCATGNSSAP